ncbi:ABC transporter substrate-binding protein [Gloeocapsopsis crepidinum]|uniref:ABC transporter substrate-binding protein n=1 Tax=Gloeocapsopsis crepidinum TaxID=693223 RepID=UPI003F714130
MGYNTARISTPPTSWEDLWKPEFAGRLGLVSMQSTVGTAFFDREGYDCRGCCGFINSFRLYCH